MKEIFSAICAATLLASLAQAQDNYGSPSTTSNTTTAGTSPTSGSSTTSSGQSSTTNNSGTVTDYTPGAAITLDPGDGKPVHFIIGDKVQVVGPDGKVIAATDVKKNSRVQLHLVKAGDRAVVDKIAVEEVQ
jgi:hypothetical protein